MDFRVRLLFLSLTASIFFLVGYLYGEMRGAGPSSIELHNMILQAAELGRPERADIFIAASDLERLEREVTAAQGWAAAASLTGEALRQRQASAHSLRGLSAQVLESALLSLASPRYGAAQGLLRALREASDVAHGRLEALLPAAAGAKANVSAGEAGGGELSVQVVERPFGAHIRRGSTTVAEVFPGFPAQRGGVRPGCELAKIAGQPVTAGTWMEAFQRARLPFEVRLRCPPPEGRGAGAGRGPVDRDPQHFRVMVVRKPFGMNIQVHIAPRVVEVLPGFPAEAAGVREGFVLTRVNEMPVDALNWFEAFQNTALPFTLTFDTTIPVRPDNPFLEKNASGRFVYMPLPALSDTEYSDFRCEVPALPFGMQIRAPLTAWPRVTSVLAKSPAAQQGVRDGDVLVEVAGRAVNSSTWFAAFQQAAPPFGLRFRRPYHMRL